jgi:hypothetical protein
MSSKSVGKNVISNVSVVKPGAKKTTKKGPKVVNPIFDQIIQFTDDYYWKGVFRSAASGKFPPGFKFYNSKLFFRIKKNDEISLIVPDDPVQAVVPIINFMSKHGDNMSDKQYEEKEKERQNNLYTEFVERMKRINSWSDIKSKNVKMELIDRFIHQTSRNFNFDTLTRNRYTFMLKLGILSKAIPSENIIVKYGDIDKIKGITFDPETQTIIRDASLHCKEDSPGKVQKKSLSAEKKKTANAFFYNQWLKFIREISGKIKKEFSAEDYSDVCSKVEEACISSVPATPVATSAKPKKGVETRSRKAKTPVEVEEEPQEEDEVDDGIDRGDEEEHDEEELDELPHEEEVDE